MAPQNKDQIDISEIAPRGPFHDLVMAYTFATGREVHRKLAERQAARDLMPKLRRRRLLFKALSWAVAALFVSGIAWDVMRRTQTDESFYWGAAILLAAFGATVTVTVRLGHCLEGCRRLIESSDEDLESFARDLGSLQDYLRPCFGGQGLLSVLVQHPDLVEATGNSFVRARRIAHAKVIERNQDPLDRPTVDESEAQLGAIEDLFRKFGFADRTVPSGSVRPEAKPVAV